MPAIFASEPFVSGYFVNLASPGLKPSCSFNRTDIRLRDMGLYVQERRSVQDVDIFNEWGVNNAYGSICYLFHQRSMQASEKTILNKGIGVKRKGFTFRRTGLSLQSWFRPGSNNLDQLVLFRYRSDIRGCSRVPRRRWILNVKKEGIASEKHLVRRTLSLVCENGGFL